MITNFRRRAKLHVPELVLYFCVGAAISVARQSGGWTSWWCALACFALGGAIVMLIMGRSER